MYGQLHTEAMEFARGQLRGVDITRLRALRDRCNATARITRDYLLQSRLAGDRWAWVGLRAMLAMSPLFRPRGP